MQFQGQNFRSPGAGFTFGPGAISPFIKLVIIINVAALVLQWAWSDMTSIFGLTPSVFYSEFPNHFYQVFTYMFLHSTQSIWHLAINMFVLWMFGTEIEYTWRTKAFAQFYLIGGVAGALLTLIFQSSLMANVVGASGAVYAVMIAYWFMFPNRLLYIYFMFPVKVKWAIPGFMIITFIANDPTIAHMAHLGGAVWGVLYMKSDWRVFRFGQKLKDLRHNQQSAKLEKRRQQAEDVMKRVDEILDKINEVGIENISKSDRKFLEDASSEMSNKRQNSEQ